MLDGIAANYNASAQNEDMHMMQGLSYHAHVMMLVQFKSLNWNIWHRRGDMQAQSSCNIFQKSIIPT